MAQGAPDPYIVADVTTASRKKKSSSRTSPFQVSFSLCVLFHADPQNFFLVIRGSLHEQGYEELSLRPIVGNMAAEPTCKAPFHENKSID